MIKIGLLGFGTVGQGVYKILEEKKEGLKRLLGSDIEIKRILVRDLEKKRTVEVSKEKLTLEPDEIIQDDDIDLIIEVTGDKELSYKLIIKSFDHGKHVVTANKAVVSAYFEALSQRAEERGFFFLYEASVAGGIPVMKPLKDQIRLNQVTRIEGILNGTCNYILTRMTEEGLSYDEVLREAQNLGFAEADPSSDVKGDDTMRKLRILSTLALGTSVMEEDIICDGIDFITAQDIDILLKRGRKIKLIAEAKESHGGYEAIVAPKAVPIDGYHAGVNGVDNCVVIEGNHSGVLGFKGPGAGMHPTANAILTDVIDCVLNTQSKINPLRERELENHNKSIRGRYYIRISKCEPAINRLDAIIEEVIMNRDGIFAFETKEVNRMEALEAVRAVENEDFVLIALED